jgi:hypothetical protein
MNSITHRNRLESQLKSYIEYLPYAPRDSFLKIANEITRILERIEVLKRMTLDQLTKDVDTYYDTKKSKINL